MISESSSAAELRRNFQWLSMADSDVSNAIMQHVAFENLLPKFMEIPDPKDFDFLLTPLWMADDIRSKIWKDSDITPYLSSVVETGRLQDISYVIRNLAEKHLENVKKLWKGPIIKKLVKKFFDSDDPNQAWEVCSFIWNLARVDRDLSIRFVEMDDTDRDLFRRRILATDARLHLVDIFKELSDAGRQFLEYIWYDGIEIRLGERLIQTGHLMTTVSLLELLNRVEPDYARRILRTIPRKEYVNQALAWIPMEPRSSNKEACLF